MESVPSFAGPRRAFAVPPGSGSPVTSASDTSVPACAQPGERHARKELLYHRACRQVAGPCKQGDRLIAATWYPGGRGIAYFILGDDGSALRQSSMITAPAAAKAAQDVR